MAIITFDIDKQKVYVVAEETDIITLEKKTKQLL